VADGAAVGVGENTSGVGSDGKEEVVVMMMMVSAKGGALRADSVTDVGVAEEVFLITGSTVLILADSGVFVGSRLAANDVAQLTSNGRIRSVGRFNRVEKGCAFINVFNWTMFWPQLVEWLPDIALFVIIFVNDILRGMCVKALVFRLPRGVYGHF
jgi:hypothetical protein